MRAYKFLLTSTTILAVTAAFGSALIAAAEDQPKGDGVEKACSQEEKACCKKRTGFFRLKHKHCCAAKGQDTQSCPHKSPETDTSNSQ